MIIFIIIIIIISITTIIIITINNILIIIITNIITFTFSDEPFNCIVLFKISMEME